MGFFARILSLLLMLGAGFQTIHAADSTIVNSSGLNKVARSTTKNIADKNARLWAEGQIKNFVTTLQTVEKRRYAFSENKLLRKEILINAKGLIQDIKNNAYDFSVTKDEKTTTEKSFSIIKKNT